MNNYINLRLRNSIISECHSIGKNETIKRDDGNFDHFILKDGYLHVYVNQKTKDVIVSRRNVKDLVPQTTLAPFIFFDGNSSNMELRYSTERVIRDESTKNRGMFSYYFEVPTGASRHNGIPITQINYAATFASNKEEYNKVVSESVELYKELKKLFRDLPEFAAELEKKYIGMPRAQTPEKVFADENIKAILARCHRGNLNSQIGSEEDDEEAFQHYKLDNDFHVYLSKKRIIITKEENLIGVSEGFSNHTVGKFPKSYFCIEPGQKKYSLYVEPSSDLANFPIVISRTIGNGNNYDVEMTNSVSMMQERIENVDEPISNMTTITKNNIGEILLESMRRTRDEHSYICYRDAMILYDELEDILRPQGKEKIKYWDFSAQPELTMEEQEAEKQELIKKIRETDDELRLLDTSKRTIRLKTRKI